MRISKSSAAYVGPLSYRTASHPMVAPRWSSRLMVRSRKLISRTGMGSPRPAVGSIAWAAAPGLGGSPTKTLSDWSSTGPDWRLMICPVSKRR